MDIGDWLQSLGLERYEAAFRENEIDETVLPTVTAEDLKDLGVDVVGHRRKLLNAISALRADADAKAPPPTTAPRLTAAATAVPTPEAVGERRHVTVMFCDLVDSTGIAAKLDAENGAIWLGRISMPPQRRSQRWAARSPSSAMG